MRSGRRISLLTPGLAAVGALLWAGATVAQDEWSVDASIYAWLPIIETEAEDGTKSEVTRDDILKDLDVAALWAVQVSKGRWSLTSDFSFLDISSKTDVALLPNLPDLATIRKAGFTAWIITPNVGYTIVDNDKQKVDVYAGARYFRIEFDVTIDIDPIGPGGTPTSQKESPSVSHWDGIAGVRGYYSLSDKWFIPYSVNAGSGESDFTWDAKVGFGYRFQDLSAVFGWRYLDYNVGSDTLLKELTLNGPFAGVVFHW